MPESRLFCSLLRFNTSTIFFLPFVLVFAIASLSLCYYEGFSVSWEAQDGLNFSNEVKGLIAHIYRLSMISKEPVRNSFTSSNSTKGT